MDERIKYVSKQTDLIHAKQDLEKIIETLNKSEWLAIDTETNGLDPFTSNLLLLQIGDGSIDVVIDLTTLDIELFRNLLENKNLILQNAKFDLKFLYKEGVVPKGKIWDTMLSNQVLYNGYNVSHSLYSIVKNFLNIELEKETVYTFLNYKAGFSERQIKYAALDVRYLHRIKELQEAELKRTKQLRAAKLENEFVKTLAYTEYCGIHLDKDKWIEKYSNAAKDIELAEKELNQFIINKLPKYIDRQINFFTEYDKEGNPIFTETIINWNSNKQVIPVFEDLGLNLSADNKTGKSVSESILLKQKDVSPIVDLYLKYKTLYKDFSTYGEKFLDWINPVTNRIHPEFKQLQVTGRLSCNSPNLQNLPSDKRTRSCFTSEEGNIMIDCDYSAQEDVLFVNSSKESKMVEFYKSGDADGHSFVAALCFPEEIGDTPNSEIKKKFPKLRQKAKSGKFALHYGGTGKTVAENLNLPIKEGKKIETAYFKAFPNIKKYLQEQKDLASKRNYILISEFSGRKVFNAGERGDYMFIKKSANFPIQGKSAEVTKIGAIYFFNWLIEAGCWNIVKIVNLVHDEVLVEAPIERVDTISSKLKEYLELGAKNYTPLVPLTADVEISTWWIH